MLLKLVYMYYRQIERVISLAGEDKGVPIGALTSDNRDLWVDVGFKYAQYYFANFLIIYVTRHAKLFLQHLRKTRSPSPISSALR